MREIQREEQGTEISPSSSEARIRKELERRISSPNFPPLDPRTEDPLTTGMHLSNADIQAIATRVTEAVRGERRRFSVRTAFGYFTAGLTGAALGAGGVIYGPKIFADEPISEPVPASRGLDSVPGGTSFTNDSLIDDRLVPKAEAETKQVNPEEVFDNTAEKGVVSERNTIGMTREEYQKIAPPPINKEAPEQFNFLFPIAFPNGLDGRKIEIKRSGDWMGGGKRTIDPVIDPATQRTVAEKGRFVVRNSLTITDGLREGDILVSPVSGKISSGLTITGIDEAGDKYSILTYGIFTSGRLSNFRLTKDIPSSRTEEAILDNGYKGFKTIESHVSIEQGEPIGIITKPVKGPLGMAGAGGNGQFQMLTFSTVVGENGTQQVGAADVKIDTSPDGKVYILKN